ncbi:MAG: CmcI family methyltransferase [Candidatus Rokuibacteriota bacterium]
MRQPVRHLRRYLRRFSGPGREGWLAQYLDRRAVSRVRQAITRRTGDASNVRWLGREIWQYPHEAWVLQEVIGTLQPELIVETGTFLGGSAYFYAGLCDLLHHGEIISIDIAARGTIAHPRITYVQGSSTDPAVVGAVAARARQVGGRRILVVLDSDHHAAHVRAELEAFAPLVPVGSYIHVQDGSMDEPPWAGTLKDEHGRPFGPGPKVAAMAFLQDHPEFVRDEELEFRYLISYHPYGWLKRI